MISFEMILDSEEAIRFDRFFWSFVEDRFGDPDAEISLTAFQGLGGERRIVQLQTAAQAADFSAAWSRAKTETRAKTPARATASFVSPEAASAAL